MRPFRSLRLEKEGPLAWLTLDRPGEGNAPDPLMAQEVRDACRLLAQDEEVRVILVTGAGEAFCIGRLPPLGLEGDLPPGEALARLRVAEAVAGLEKPVIAVIAGPAIGQGLEIALACDLRLCTPEARFSLPHLLHGLLPWDGGTQRLPRIVGRAWAQDLLLTGREVSAEEALGMGLVHQVVPRREVRARAEEVARRIASFGPIAVRYTKELVLRGMDLPLEPALRLEADLNILLHSTHDRAEGIRSFLERRPPRFEGR